MTGYGRSEQTIQEKVFVVELRSLNGKQFDLLLKLPPQLKPYEFEIRNHLSESMIRGSVECNISIKQNGASRPSAINIDLASAYYKQLKSLADQMEADDAQLLASILRLPEVVAASSEIITETEWQVLKKTLAEAVAMINKHKDDEGEALEKELLLRISNIEKLQTSVMELEPLRKKKIRENLLKLLE
ncbi:MAG: hypothetical protein RLZZ172_1065, partial [Bacteroidota bacterium]